MLFTILILYLILFLLCAFEKKKKTELIVYNQGEFFIQIFVIISFFFYYVLFLRLLGLFRETQSLDLHKINFNINLILCIIFFYVLKKYLFFFFKISWFKFHYVMMCENNFSEFINKNYKFIFYNIIYSPALFIFKFLIFLKNLDFFGFLLIILYDCYFNDLILNYSLVFLKYYSFFKIIYISCIFMATKQNLILDYYSYNLMYPGIIEKNIFINFVDSTHQSLMDESIKYNHGVILDHFEFKSKDLGDTTKMPFFKFINR